MLSSSPPSPNSAPLGLEVGGDRDVASDQIVDVREGVDGRDQFLVALDGPAGARDRPADAVDLAHDVLGVGATLILEVVLEIREIGLDLVVAVLELRLPGRFVVFVVLVLVRLGRIGNLDFLEIVTKRLEIGFDDVEVVFGLGRLEVFAELREVGLGRLEIVLDGVEIGADASVSASSSAPSSASGSSSLMRTPSSRRRSRVTAFIRYGRVRIALSVSMRVGVRRRGTLAPVEHRTEDHVRDTEDQEREGKRSVGKTGTRMASTWTTPMIPASRASRSGYWIRETIR